MGRVFALFIQNIYVGDEAPLLLLSLHIYQTNERYDKKREKFFEPRLFLRRPQK